MYLNCDPLPPPSLPLSLPVSLPPSLPPQLLYFHSTKDLCEKLKVANVTTSLGGTLLYNHQTWINDRVVSLPPLLCSPSLTLPSFLHHLPPSLLLLSLPPSLPPSFPPTLPLSFLSPSLPPSLPPSPPSLIPLSLLPSLPPSLIPLSIPPPSPPCSTMRRWPFYTGRQWTDSH